MKKDNSASPQPDTNSQCKAVAFVDALDSYLDARETLNKVQAEAIATYGYTIYELISFEVSACDKARELLLNVVRGLNLR